MLIDGVWGTTKPHFEDYNVDNKFYDVIINLFILQVFFMYVFNMIASLPDKSAVMEETDQELNR